MKLFPVGTLRRWLQISTYVGTRSDTEVIEAVKSNLALGSKAWLQKPPHPRRSRLRGATQPL